MKVNIDKERTLGAIGVLENYIIGALSDYECGQIEDTTCLDDSIYIYDLLELVRTGGWSSLIKSEYRERFEKARKEK